MRCSISMLSSIRPKWAPSQRKKWVLNKGNGFHTLSKQCKKKILHCPKIHRRIDCQSLLILTWIFTNNLGKYYFFILLMHVLPELGILPEWEFTFNINSESINYNFQEAQSSREEGRRIGWRYDMVCPWVSWFFVIITKHQIQDAYEGKKDLPSSLLRRLKVWMTL